MGNRKWTGESLLAREELNDELKRDRLGARTAAHSRSAEEGT
jgi:hypothetical protein